MIDFSIDNFLLPCEGFTGTQCEIDIDECKDQPCLNGGVCQDFINSFKCSCAIGFTGSRCQINIDDCVSSPCRNGGTCHDSIAGYTCECPPGFTGNNKISQEQNFVVAIFNDFFFLQDLHAKRTSTIVFHPHANTGNVLMARIRSFACVIQVTLAFFVTHKLTNANRIRVSLVVFVRIWSMVINVFVKLEHPDRIVRSM